MAKYNFTATMSLQLLAIATVIVCAAASAEEQVSSSKYAKWAEHKKMAERVRLSTSEEQTKSAAEEEKHNKASCAAAPASSSTKEEEELKQQKSSASASASSENGKSTTNFRPNAEELENLNDKQLRKVAASLMAQKDVPISFHDHPKHQCWQKCAFEKVKPYCDHLLIASTIQGCLLAGGKACALYCTGGSLN